MAYFQTPQLNYVDAENVYSGPTSMFLASMHAGRRAALEQRAQASREAQLQAEADQFDRMMQERQTDNERDQRRINMEDARLRDQMSQTKELAEAKLKKDELDKKREIGGKIHDAVASGDIDTARALTAIYGGTLNIGAFTPGGGLSPIYPVQQPAPADAPAQQPAPAPQQVPDFSDELGPDVASVQPPKFEPDAAPVAPAPAPLPHQAPVAPALKPEAPAAGPGGVRIEMPGLPPIMTSQFAAADAKNAAMVRQRQINIEQGAPIIRALAARATTPFDKEAVRLAENQVAAGELAPGEIGKFVKDESDKLRAEEMHRQNAKTSAGAARANREETGGRGAVRDLRADLKDWEANWNIRKMNASRQALGEALHTMQADSKIGKFGAYESFLKGLRGGAPTSFVMEEAQKHTGGVWDQFKNAVARAESGDYSPEVQRDIVAGIRATLEGLQHQRVSAQEDYTSQFGDPLYDEVRGNVNAYGRALFGKGYSSGETKTSIAPSGKKVPAKPANEPEPKRKTLNQHMKDLGL